MKSYDLLFKQARISTIPSTWELSRIGDSCRIRNDLRKPISVSDREKIQGEYPYYGPTGVLDHINEFLIDGRYALIGEDGDHFLKPTEKTQTILVSGRFNVNNHAHIIASTEKCDAAWFHKFFEHRNITDFLSRQGANRYKLNKETLNKLPILLPPLPEQKAIADLLSTWDDAITTTEKLILAKEKRLDALQNNLMRFNPRASHSPRSVKFGSFLTESRISGTDGAVARKLTVKLYGKGVIAKDEKRIGSATTKYYTRRKGQLIYSKLDFLNGAFGLIPEDLDGYESTLDLPAFDISNDVSKEWLLYYLTRPAYYSRQIGLAKGQRKARRVSPDELLNSKIPLPDLATQHKISDALSDADREINLLKQLAERYREQKRGLMQKMLSGAWRVKPEVVKSYE